MKSTHYPTKQRHLSLSNYGVATISRLLKIIGLFCRIQSLLYDFFASETYNFKEPTNRSHSISYISFYILSYHFLSLYPTKRTLYSMKRALHPTKQQCISRLNYHISLYIYYDITFYISIQLYPTKRTLYSKKAL